jgi:choice-of-anchor C domain-containing protein
MKRILVLGIISIVLLACVGVVSAVNLVNNGGFETPPLSSDYAFNIGSLPGWSITNDIDLIKTYNGWTASEGAQSIDLSGSVRGTISQTITTEIGSTYKLTFSMAGNPEGGQTPKILNVEINDNPAGSFSFTPTGMPGPGQWQFETITFTASSTTTKIAFIDATTEGNPACGVALDDIVVEKQQPIPTPEFPTMALPAALIIGLLGVVLFMQRNKE